MPARLSGKVALVTGAKRGIGKSVTLGLGEEGCTVYVTGKTFRNGDSNRPGSVTATAEEVSNIGGRGIAMVCDHHVDSQTEAVFQRVQKEQDRLDILVNNATSYSTDIGPHEDHPFWESALQDWDEMNAVGLRSHYVASLFAARMMIPKRRGLIVNISSMGAIQYTGSVSYNVVKGGGDMLTLGTAEDLYPDYFA